MSDTLKPRKSANELASMATNMLQEIAATTASTLVAKKRSRDPIHVNIKVNRTYQRCKEPRYAILARSRNPDERRVAEDNKRLEPHRIHSNAIYRYILNKRGSQDFCPVPDIRDFLEKYAREWDCTEPHPYSAPELYQSALVVAIKGPKSDALDSQEFPNEGIALPFGDRDMLLGFICADSLCPGTFNTEWDLAVMREAASDAFEAIRLWYAVHAASKFGGLRLV